MAAVATALAGLIGASAEAHNRVTWYWSTSLAERRVLTSPKTEQVLRAWLIEDAECEPFGKWIWSDGRPRQKLYKHFHCLIRYSVEEEECDEFGCYPGDIVSYETERVLHVLGRFDFALWRA